MSKRTWTIPVCNTCHRLASWPFCEHRPSTWSSNSHQELNWFRYVTVRAVSKKEEVDG